MALSDTLERNAQNYDSQMTLLTPCWEELNWWDAQMCKWNGKSMLKMETNLTIDLDASLRGWGAHWHLQIIGGPWSEEETRMHINCMELLTVTLAVQSFAKGKTRISILLRIDNTTAVAYINHLGGTISRDLVKLTENLWIWCLERNIHITAQYLPGSLNTIANAESQTLIDRTDWKLNLIVFHKTDQHWGPLEVDLFASWLSTQGQRYFSWRPDPSAEATDAFLQKWTHMRGMPIHLRT